MGAAVATRIHGRAKINNGSPLSRNGTSTVSPIATSYRRDLGSASSARQFTRQRSLSRNKPWAHGLTTHCAVITSERHHDLYAARLTWAAPRGLRDAVPLLDATLKEEEEADDLLIRLAGVDVTRETA